MAELRRVQTLLSASQIRSFPSMLWSYHVNILRCFLILPLYKVKTPSLLNSLLWILPGFFFQLTPFFNVDAALPSVIVYLTLGIEPLMCITSNAPDTSTQCFVQYLFSVCTVSLSKVEKSKSTRLLLFLFIVDHYLRDKNLNFLLTARPIPLSCWPMLSSVSILPLPYSLVVNITYICDNKTPRAVCYIILACPFFQNMIHSIFFEITKESRFP